MKKIIISIIVIGLLLSTAPLTMSGKEAVGGTSLDLGEAVQHVPIDDSFQLPEFVPGELIVKFREEAYVCMSVSPDGILCTDVPSVDALNRKYQVDSAERIFKYNLVPSLSNVYKFTLPDDASIFSIAEEYNGDPSVEYAEPNYVYHFCNVPNDPYFSQQWALNQLSDCDIDAPEAWNIETGSSDVIIAVVDSGVDYNHPDLMNNMWINEGEILNGNDTDGNGYIDDIRGWDFEDDDNDPMDEYGHGTHCSGIAAAVTNNSVGIAGVCWNCTIMSIKIGGTSGLPEDAVANGIIYAADNGADIISMSWGGYFNSSLIRDAVEYVYNEGVVPVAAAGNENAAIKSYPAAYDEVIAVAATGNNDTRADFSNYGNWVDVAAPGVDIYSTMPDDSYDEKSGTSMACPHVAGLAGLLLSKNQSLSQDMIKTIISNAVDLVNSSEYIGKGRINAFEALKREPAIAILDNFPDWTDVKGIIDITGKAWGVNFQHYVIDYGRGKQPDTWIELENSSFPVQEDILASLDTTELDEGLYTIRLKVFCSDGVYEDIILIVVNNEYNVFVVDDDDDGGPGIYTIIQEAVFDAGRGDTVYVHNGTYYNGVIIDRSIQLFGENATNSFILGDEDDIPGFGHTPGVQILADQVEVTGFTIKKFLSYGLVVWNSKNNQIFNNYIIIESTHADGIKLMFSDKNIISNNTINTILLHGSITGIELICSHNNVISGNVISNMVTGIYLVSSGDNNICNNLLQDITSDAIRITDVGPQLPSFNNTISDNIILGNKVGIYLIFTSGDIIIRNTIVDNDKGIFLKVSSNHLIYHNNFINNTINACDESGGTNYWDDGYPSGGNYWDDYIGIDVDGDGIGDTPYNISGGSNQDLYPLMYPWGEMPPVANFTYSIDDYVVTFNASESFDHDGTILSYDWSFNDGTNDTGEIVVHQFSQYGEHTVTLTATDDDGNTGNITKVISVDDLILPEIIDNSPSTGYTGDSFTFQATITDYAGISSAWVEYWYGSGGHFNFSMTNVGGDNWEKAIIIEDTLETMHYFISANDMSDNWNTTETKDVTIYDNDDPEINDIHADPEIQIVGRYVNISATITDNIEIQSVIIHLRYPDAYEEDIDITQNNLGDIYFLNRTFNQLGEHRYHFEATDTSDNTIISDTYMFCIRDNEPPYAPLITGPTSGEAGEEYEYTFSADDPDGDGIYLWIEWGDGQVEEWIGPYASGEEVTISHTWSEQGTYEIGAKAKDVFGAESDWGYLDVTMPFNQVTRRSAPSSQTFQSIIKTTLPMSR